MPQPSSPLAGVGRYDFMQWVSGSGKATGQGAQSIREEGACSARPPSAEGWVRGEARCDARGAVLLCLLSSPAPTARVLLGPVTSDALLQPSLPGGKVLFPLHFTYKGKRSQKAVPHHVSLELELRLCIE